VWPQRPRRSNLEALNMKTPKSTPATPRAGARRQLAGVLLLAASALGATLAPPARAASYFDVSQLVLGATQLTPVLPGSVPVPCGSACQYVITSSAGLDSSYTPEPGPYMANAWPPVFGTSLPGIGTVDETGTLPPPANGTDTLDGGSLGVNRRSAVDFSSQPVLSGSRKMSVQTWKSGSGASVVGIAIRINTPSSGSKPTYLEFDVPVLARGFRDAYFVGGPSGDQPIYTDPKRAQTRSAVDVYVNGLPVWSSQSNHLRPRRDNDSQDVQLLQWGPKLEDDKVTLYLGRLPAGSTRTVTMLIRTDLRVDAPTCKHDTEYSVGYERCHVQMESLTLPAQLISSSSGQFQFVSYKPSINVYTR
jgi:hypothetical protein